MQEENSLFENKTFKIFLQRYDVTLRPRIFVGDTNQWMSKCWNRKWDCV